MCPLRTTPSTRPPARWAAKVTRASVASISKARSSAEVAASRICCGVRNEGRPQASEAASGTRALSIAISLIADRRALATARAVKSGGVVMLPVVRAMIQPNASVLTVLYPKASPCVPFCFTV